MDTPACCVCSQIAGDAANDLIARLLPEQSYVRRILFENDSFAVIPSLGPLTPGHSLLCPKVHIRSFASLDDALHPQFAVTRATLVDALRSLYRQEVHLFEHGMARNGDRTLCTVEHAHMHFVPLPEGIELPLDRFMTFDGSLASLRALTRDDEYVLYVAPDGSSRVLTSAGGVESQYMRKLIVDHLGQGGEWNWRTAPHAHAADEAWRRFVNAS
ncbi:MAG TPA: HIT domain-containing protein [Thermoanaerobaculia bacterium]|jgi:diadenosine tetraphosphate (Ap4A) HIT family hydrolase|nr:HIT domain-containing protein [Thermoanaerobaculia bacterium]